MGKRNIEELVKAIQEAKDGNEGLFQQLEEKAKELDIRLDFWADDRAYYRVNRFGPNVSIEGHDGKWDTDGEPISPEEYLDALREFLVFELRDAEQAKYELMNLILRFTKKQAGHRDLKDAVRGLSSLPKTNLIINENLCPNLLKVWTPTPAPAKELIEAIEGVVRVHYNTTQGYLSVWFNPCYDKDVLTIEIKAAILGI